jgi:glycosyltransferase involved in cell wall biosynthesis
MQSPNASVIIPAYNSHKTLERSIIGCQEQTAWDSLDRIIIVDSSDDPVSLELLEKLKQQEKVEVITSGVRVMPAIQRNIGAKNAQSKILCFLDSDAYPEKDWIEKIIAVYKSGTLVGAGSYKLPEFQKDKKIAKAQYYLEFNEFIDVGKPRKKKLAPSCNLFCDRKLFIEIGGFPELRASEDTLFGLKVSKYADIIFYPDISVYHIFRDTKEHYFNNQVLLGKYIFIYRKKTYNSLYYRGILPYIFFPFFMLVKLFRILSRLAKADSIHIRQFLSATGLFFAGLFYWGRGFWKGIREYKNEKAVLSEIQ